MIEVVGIPYTDIQNHPELLAEYASECSIPALGKPEPRWGMYELMESAGMIKVFAVYLDNLMVGFGSVLTTVLPHYGFKAATVESLFVAKGYRDTVAGARLISTIEEYAALQGCKGIFYGAPAGGSMEAVLAKRYRPVSSNFYRPLD